MRKLSYLILSLLLCGQMTYANNKTDSVFDKLQNDADFQVAIMASYCAYLNGEINISKNDAEFLRLTNLALARSKIIAQKINEAVLADIKSGKTPKNTDPTVYRLANMDFAEGYFHAWATSTGIRIAKEAIQNYQDEMGDETPTRPMKGLVGIVEPDIGFISREILEQTACNLIGR